jgi:hypothetical protein
MMAHGCNLRRLELQKLEALGFKASLDKKLEKHHLNEQAGHGGSYPEDLSSRDPT